MLSGRALDVNQLRTRASARSRRCTGAIIPYSIDVRASKSTLRAYGQQSRCTRESSMRTAETSGETASKTVTTTRGPHQSSPAASADRVGERVRGAAAAIRPVVGDVEAPQIRGGAF